MTGRPGPAYLAIPDDVLAMEIDADKLPPIYPAARYRVPDMGAGDPLVITEAAEWLARAAHLVGGSERVTGTAMYALYLLSVWIHILAAADLRALQTQIERRRASVLGRIDVVLALILVVLGVMLVRGVPW